MEICVCTNNGSRECVCVCVCVFGQWSLKVCTHSWCVCKHDEIISRQIKNDEISSCVNYSLVRVTITIFKKQNFQVETDALESNYSTGTVELASLCHKIATRETDNRVWY